jgi:hypothetical protein
MRLASNRQREKAIFDIFRDKYDLLGGFKLGGFKHLDTPDFWGDDGILGVEITELYSDEKTYGKELREHEAAKERIVNKASKKAQELGLPPLDVHVVFVGDIPKGKESDLIKSLFEVVNSNCPDAGHEKVLSIDSDLPEGFGAILINRQCSKKHIWDWGEAGDVETDFSAQLQCRINEKAKKFPEYQKNRKKCWLIIAALGFRPSSFYEFEEDDEDMEASCYESPFEKVFFMEVSREKLKELKVLRK